MLLSTIKRQEFFISRLINERKKILYFDISLRKTISGEYFAVINRKSETCNVLVLFIEGQEWLLCFEENTDKEEYILIIDTKRQEWHSSLL